MTISEYHTAAGHRERGYSAGYDRGYWDARDRQPFCRPERESWSYRDGYVDGFEDGSATLHDRALSELSITKGVKP